MKIIPSSSSGTLPLRRPGIAVGMLAALLFAGAITGVLQAQPGPPRRDELPPRRDLRVVIENPHTAPRFLEGPRREEFAFVRELPRGRIIDRR